MTWEEYKKKNKIKQNNFSTVQSQRQIAPINTRSSQTTSSWEEYKKKNNIKPNRLSSEYQEKNTIAGQIKNITNSFGNSLKNVMTSDTMKTLATNIQNEKEKELKENISNRIISKTNNLQSTYKIEDYNIRDRKNVINTNVIIDKEGNVYDTMKLSREEREELENLEGTKRGEAEIDNGELISFVDTTKLETGGIEKLEENNTNMKEFGKNAIKDLGLIYPRVKAPNATYIIEQYAKGTTDAARAMEIWGRSHLGAIQEELGFDDAKEKQREAILKLNSEIQTPVKKSDRVNKVGEIGGQVFNTIGNMMPSMISSVLPIPGAGIISTASMGANVSGQDIGEGIAEGESFAQANLGGDLKGATSMALEKIAGGVKIGTKQGKGALDDIVGNAIAKRTSNNITNFLATKGYQFTGEIVEENLENVAGYLIDALVDKKELPDIKTVLQEAGETTSSTFLTTLTLNCLGFGGDNLSTYKELEKATGKKLTKNQKKAIDEVVEKARNQIMESNTQNVQKNGNNLQQQQTILDSNKMAQNQNMEQITNNNGLIYYESAKRYNIDTNNELVQSIERVTSERGIKAKYDANIFTDDTQGAIWRISNDENGNIVREVIINPNANTKKSLESIAIHELIHDLEGTEEYNKLKELVLSYDKGKVGFEESRQALEKLYSTVYDKNSVEFNELINNEAVADILGSKLGDQNFIYSLNSQNKTLTQRIYSWVVDKLNRINKLTGYKSEKLFWADIKNKFESAFKQEYQYNNNNELYSIAGKTGMNNLIKNNPKKYMELEQSHNKAKQLRKNGVDNETIRQQTRWFQDKNGDWKFEFSDKDMELKSNIKLENRKTYKLGDILEHDTLFMAYPELVDYDVIIDNTLKANGAFAHSINTIKLNSKIINNPELLEGTLIHEIQHTIQNIEGFERGKSHKGSKYAYYNSLGEIESSDIKERFLAEKYDDKDLKNIAPESSKKNPRHKNLSNYLNNRTIVDKVKDSIYNYLKIKMKGDNYFESYEKNRKAVASNKNNPKNSGSYRVMVDGGGRLNESSQKYMDKNVQPNNLLMDGRRRLNEKESENNSGSFSIQGEENIWQNRLDTLYKNKNKGTTIKELRIPTKEDIKKEIAPKAKISDNKKEVIAPIVKDNFNIDLLTDADYEVLNKIYEKEGRTEVLTEKKKAKILEKYANDKFAIKDSIDIMAQKFVNKGHYVDKLAEQSKNLELKYVYDKTLNSFAEGQYVIGVAQTDNSGKKIGKSITEIWQPIKESGLTKEFSEYMLHKHNIDRAGKNKYVFGKEIGPTESTAIALELENKHPEFKNYAEDIKKFNHNSLNSLKETGMITQDTIDYIEALYPNYVVISRSYEDGIYVGNNEKTGAIAPLKKATGGNSDIQPIEDAMAQQAIRIKRLNNQNELGKQLAKSLKNAQIDEGVDISLAPTMLMDMETMVDADTSGNKYYIFFEDGKQKKLKINDELYESLKPTEISKLEKTLPVKALQKVSSIHRNLLTTNNPLFIVTNFFKDFQDGIFNSKYSKKFIKNYGKALNEIRIKGKYYESYMANGGNTNTYFDYESGIKKKGNKFVQKIRNVNEYVEQLPRLAEFISTLEDGKSLNEALYNAAEITTNFKRGGDITKALNRNGVNFLNASVQGLDKQFRNFKGQNGAKGYVNLLAKAVTIGVLPSILNHMLLDDDDGYQDLPQSTKDLYYLFKYDDGKFIRIPKGRVLSVFGSATRRTLETVEGQEDAWDGFKDTVVNQIAPNNPLEDNILAPIYQVKNNKTWYGGELVSSRLLKELPKNQYDETTDEFSKWLGSKLNMSPKKINYLIDQYSGGIGDIVLPYITPQAKKNPVIDKFTTDSVLKNKNVSKFYETLEKQTQIANDNFATDEDELQLKYLNGISKEMGSLYKEKRQIQMGKISNKEKTEKVREIQAQINELAEKGLNEYRNVKKGEYSAKTSGQEYYKNSKGEWTTLSEEEQEKNKNVSIETYSNYKQKVYEETDKQRKSGELSGKQQLKDKDKIQILLDSKYSKKEITEIYENYIKSNNDKNYEIMKKTGIDIKEYLKYKQQDFDSDTKDNGTTKGKTVSGSAKKKVYSYVNGMDITYEQRLMLLGTQYKLNDTECTKLYNYVKSLNYTQDEMQKVFESLKGFTVYKDGSVTW